MKIEINKKEIENIVGMYISDKYPDVKLEWQDNSLVADVSIIPDHRSSSAKEEHQDTTHTTDKPEDNTVTGLFN